MDEQDKRKKRIELTDYCQEFCEKNDEMSRALLKRMFAGVSEEQLQITIQTIIQIEDNLKYEVWLPVIRKDNSKVR